MVADSIDVRLRDPDPRDHRRSLLGALRQLRSHGVAHVIGKAAGRACYAYQLKKYDLNLRRLIHRMDDVPIPLRPAAGD